MMKSTEEAKKQDPKGLVIAITKIMLLSSSGNVYQDTHRARMIHNPLRQNEKKRLQDYYSRTMTSIARQVSLGYKSDADIDQAMDFTYKLDRKLFQTMITNVDWIEESETRKYQVALRADSTVVHVTTYPANLAEAFQRANSYQIRHGKTTTGTDADNCPTVFATEASNDTGNKKEKIKRKMVPRAEWLKLTTEHKDVMHSSVSRREVGKFHSMR